VENAVLKDLLLSPVEAERARFPGALARISVVESFKETGEPEMGAG
jgi:hypothetical protein